ncbi:PD-(D/E)XK nuclease family protein [Halogranum amylolyticum]|uniref:PD-(D/E)XK nuclease family protein n=1 Tax=Halogranum amylolyticum TaxID=660520 RepID=UPI00147C2F78|nr:PD-(D/E)XK nuclease family protein [Halogranum amylolyticum]
MTTTALERAAALADPQPASVLYLTARSEQPNEIERRWNAIDETLPIQLQVTTFDTLVDRALESVQSTSTQLSLERRYRLVEAALSALEDPTNKLYTDREPPRSGLVSQVEDLLSLLEFAGEITPEAIETRLTAEGIPEIAADLRAVSEGFHGARESLRVGTQAETLRAERYTQTINSGAIDAALSTVDVVVLGRFTLFSPLEAQLIEAISETTPTVGMLALANAPPTGTLAETRDTLQGVDRGVERALRVYDTLGFEQTYVEAPPTAPEITQSLFTATTDPLEATNIDWHEYQTANHELRGVCRAIREQLSAGVDPTNIGVVLTDHAGSHEQLRAQLDAYEIPAAVSESRPLTKTSVGRALAAIFDLAREPSAESLLTIFSNPVVTPDGTLATVDINQLALVADRHETTRLDVLLDTYAETDDAAEERAALEAFCTDCQALTECPLEDIPTQVEAIFSTLGITEAAFEAPTGTTERLEQQAYHTVRRILDSLEATASLFENDPVERTRQALEYTTVETEPQRTDAHVAVVGLTESVGRSFEQVYVVGLTTTNFPSQSPRLAFTKAINEAHPDFEAADQKLEARYAFGSVLTQADSIVLSHPMRTPEGAPLVEADVLAELRRVAECEPVTIDDEQADTQSESVQRALAPGTREDLYRGAARSIAEHDDPTAVAETLADSSALTDGTDAVTTRLMNGTACAAARGTPSITDYDGQLDSRTVETHYGTDTAYSPSAIETYAGCGFKFYLQRVLDIAEPDEHTLEADHLERGRFIHAILERYYQEAQSTPGTPVDPTVRREDDLLTVANDVLSEYTAYGTAFHDGWLRQVFAGLGDPEQNEYYETPTGFGEYGLLVTFLDEETSGKTTGQPAYLEGRIGRRRSGDRTVLTEEPVTLPGSDVTIQGQLDRIDLVPETDPTEAVVYDYKTGSSMPSTTETFEGLRFQLPLYAHLIETLVDDIETVGGAYYQTSPPTDVTKRGIIGSKAKASHTYGGPAPIRYHSQSLPATHRGDADSFRTFIEETVVENVEAVVDGIQQGSYQPTVLAPSYPNCEHCAYRAACDVRHHHRHEVIDQLDAQGVSAYVPELVQEVDAADGGATQ